jgi:molecular chaperone DnaK
MKLGQAIYESQQGGGANQAQADTAENAQASDEEVVDAEYSEVDEDKKA